MIRGRARLRELFPVSLYASLLLAMVCLVRPEPARIVQRVGTSVAALPLRAWHVLAPVRVADARENVDRRRSSRLGSGSSPGCAPPACPRSGSPCPS